MNRLVGFACIAFVLFLLACTNSKKIVDTPPPGADTIANKLFTAVDLKGKWTITAIMPANDSASRSLGEAFITFADSSFGGKAPCNHIGGAYSTTAQNNIRFSKIISTKMACERITEENVFIDYLSNKVISFSMTHNSLILKDSLGRELITLRKGE